MTVASMTVASWIVTGVLAWVIFAALILAIVRVCGRPTPKPPQATDGLLGSAGRVVAGNRSAAGHDPARRTQTVERPGMSGPGAP